MVLMDGGLTQHVVRQPCEVYSRVVGYLRPVAQWNKGKRQEFRDRKTYRGSGVSGEE